jgi:virginiamycin B lyase
MPAPTPARCRIAVRSLYFAALLPWIATSAYSSTYSNISQFAVPTAGAAPNRIATGRDGALWFTEMSANKIGRITMAGVITEYPIPTANSQPNSIVSGEGGMWFTETEGNKIGWISLFGAFHEFRIPTAKSSPVGIAVGPDRAIWFAESAAHKIGRMTETGSFTEYTVPGGFYNTPYDITNGPDGALWFTENQGDGNEIVRITTSGEMTEFYVPTSNAQPTTIVTGPDGALWFTEYAIGNIGSMTTSGVFSEYGMGGREGSAPIGITAAPDGALWFTAENWGCIQPCPQTILGRMTTAGSSTLFTVPVPSGAFPWGANGIAAGPDGNLWLAEGNANEIDRAPVCALGLSVSFAGNTLTTSFDMGIDRPANWRVSAASTILVNQETAAVAPPSVFALNWDTFADRGNVLVESALATFAGEVLCAESATVNTGP